MPAAGALFSPGILVSVRQTLEKSYILEPEEDVIPKRFEGCAIEWKDPSLDVTVELSRRAGFSWAS
eukprot:1141325-Pelagomonas_calceolata.AAC.3